MLFKRFTLFFVLLFHALSGICKQDRKNLHHPNERQLSIREYEAIVKRYRYSHPDSAMYFANKAMALARRQKDQEGLAIMLNQSGMIDDNFGKFEDSRQKYLQAASIYKAIGSKKGEATETIRLGVVELRKGNYDKSVGYFLEALKLSESIRDSAGIMESHVTLGEAAMGQKKWDLALKYLKTAERIDKKLPFSSLSLNICINFGTVYREKGDFASAISYIKKGLGLSNSPQLYGLHITLMNSLASVYAKQGFKERSIDLQKEALKKSREIDNYIREYQTLLALADNYGKAKPDYSLSYLAQALELTRNKNAHKQEIEVLERMGDLNKYLGKYAIALDLKEKAHAIADSFFYKNMSRQIASLQSDYELNKSLARVQQLKYDNNRQTLESKIILCITAGIAMLLLILCFYYYQTRRFNRKLNKANAELKEMNSVKDKLFSILAHDLRLPLSSVINLLDILNDEDITPAERHDIVNKLIVNCHASLDTLNQLLRWREMQIKGIRINTTAFSPATSINRNITLLAAASDNKSIHVRNLVDDSVQVVCDPDHFDFIIRNLLMNAIKFTPKKGRVWISASDRGDMVEFSVKDSGIGIEKSRVQGLFTINNISTYGTNNEKGTSLGLVMCREFIEANNGTIEVHSEVGKGSNFIFSVPSVRADQLNFGSTIDIKS